MNSSQTWIDRFWEKVLIAPPMTCWEWVGSRDSKGYGQIWISTYPVRSLQRAHRVSYELHNGPIPDGLMVRHVCDNPGCVNPDHLQVGTHIDNMRDRRERGVKKEKPPRVYGKLTDRDVRLIRESELTGVELAELLNVSPSTISKVKNRKRRENVRQVD